MNKFDGTVFRFKTPILKKSKNRKILLDFIKYCVNHPDERFWQALRNWSGFHYIFSCRVPKEVARDYDLHDTFYLEEKE